MKSIVEVCHDFLKPAVHSGAICIDATLGQGKDTRFFLEQKALKVYAFEVQEALCQKALDTFSQYPQFHLFSTGHEHMQKALAVSLGSVDAIVFNFGWDPQMPGSLTTKTETSLSAVAQALTLLKGKGRLALVMYPHKEGRREQEAIRSFLKETEGFDVMEVSMPFKECPCAFLVEKKPVRKGII